MHVAACISPILPHQIVGTEELHELVDASFEHVDGYTVSTGFAYTDETDEHFGLSQLPDFQNYTTYNHVNPLVPKPTFTGWHMYSDPRTHALKKYMRTKKRPAFSRSTQLVKYLIAGDEIKRGQQD